MNRQIACIACGVGIALSLVCISASAQSTGNDASRQMRSIYNQSIGTGYTVSSLMQMQRNRDRISLPPVGGLDSGIRRSAGGSGSGLVSPSSKPFSSYSPLPTVSPYMNLFRDDFDGSSDFNYQTLVRPQIQQREFNQRVQNDLSQNERRLQSIAAQNDFNIQGSTSMPATGHATTFMNHSHFYPVPNRRR